MNLAYTVMTIFLFASVGLGILLARRIGKMRASLVTLFRLLWLTPLMLAFFPVSITKPLPRSLSLKPIHVLIDDSSSMKRKGEEDRTPYAITGGLLDRLQSQCERLGCYLKKTYLSDLDKRVDKGISPLNDNLMGWFFSVGDHPWIIATDGGDSQPTLPWQHQLSGLGARHGSSDQPRGLILGYWGKKQENVWITDFKIHPFSFESKPIVLDLSLNRSLDIESKLRVQAQILADTKALATVNVKFEPGQEATEVRIPIPPLLRGQHLIEAKVLPAAEEKILWDNTAYNHVEVLPNTVGVLHLLGSPSWDGRFLRRYLKAEPKYDLISFFILRDPWDSQAANERELSLIPFPVDRLFNEELPNFRVVIIQNFRLVQFLLPDYQRNLVNFVKDGGALLFLGGPRALGHQDLSGSPLAEILPFHMTSSNKMTRTSLFSPIGTNPQIGPYYDRDLRFTIQLANPDEEKKALANVFDEWQLLGDYFQRTTNLKGMHRTDNVTFKSSEYTPLLEAKTDQGSFPLAVASYPNKGRAIWIFTDQFWNLAMTSQVASRQNYNQFFQSAMTWLMRKDLRKPLIAKNFILRQHQSSKVSWQVTLQGPGSRYFQLNKDWQLTVCGEGVSPQHVKSEKSGTDRWILSGFLRSQLKPEKKCRLNLNGKHPAFGSVALSLSTIFPPLYRDDEVLASQNKLQKLSDLTQAPLINVNADDSQMRSKIDKWIEGVSGTEGIALPSRMQTVQDHYWVQSRWWFWCLLMFLPFEVIARLWHRLASS